MVRLQDIIVPTDLSEYSLSALPYAFALARRGKGRIILAYFTHSQEVASYARRRLDEVREQLQPLNSEALVEVGFPSRALAELARSRHADLIVMATHGRTGLARTVLGSTAEEVVRQAECPVMVVRHPHHGFVIHQPPSPPQPDVRKFPVLDLAGRRPTDEDLYFAQLDRELIRQAAAARERERGPGYEIHVRRIVVPVDFSLLSLGAVEYARELARAFGARINLVHVLDESAGLLGFASGRPDPSDYVRADVMDVRRRLKTIAHFLGDVHVSSSLSFGQPHPAIAAIAASHQADLIVLATHGRSGVKRVALGSTAEGLVRHAPCPVITLRRPVPSAAVVELAEEVGAPSAARNG